MFLGIQLLKNEFLSDSVVFLGLLLLLLGQGAYIILMISEICFKVMTEVDD